MVQYTHKELQYMSQLVERNMQSFMDSHGIDRIRSHNSAIDSSVDVFFEPSKNGLSKPMSDLERKRRQRIKNKTNKILDYLVLVEKSGIWPNISMNLMERTIENMVKFKKEKKPI